MQKSTKYVTKPTQQQLFLYTKYHDRYYFNKISLSSEVRGPRVVLYEFLGGDDVSLGPWNP